ncbi:MAG: hypothetical protein WC627_02545 [Legionella sp.]|jgi:hypothetical protein
MRYDSTKVKNLINSYKLEDALEILQRHFIKSQHAYEEDIEYLNQIITFALTKNDVTLAIKAAMNRLDWWGYFKIPESASWSTIISKAHQKSSFDTLDFPNRLLVPKEDNYTPMVLNTMAVKLWKHLQQNEWSLPGIKVLFGAYGRKPTKENPALLLRKVEGIKGDDFFIGFSGSQGLTTEDRNLNDTGGFSFIAVANFYIAFYDKGSEPSIYKYNKNDWKDQIAKINSPYFSGYGKAGWEEIDCRIPGKNEIYINYLFFNQEDIEAKMSEHRANGLSTKKSFVQAAAKALEASLTPIFEQSNNMSQGPAFF